MRIETTININRSVEDVMEFLTKPENLPVWTENVVEATQTSQGPVGLGTTCRIVSEVMQRRMSHDFAVTEFLPGKKYAVSSVNGPFPMSLTYAIEPFDGGSQLHSVTEFNFPGLTAFVELAMRDRVRERFESDHRNLKRILES